MHQVSFTAPTVIGRWLEESNNRKVAVNHFNVIDFTRNLCPPSYRGFISALEHNPVERYYLELVQHVEPRLGSNEVRYLADGFKTVPIAAYYKHCLSMFTGCIFDPQSLTEWLTRSVMTSPSCAGVGTYNRLERFGGELITDQGIYEVSPRTIVLDFEHPDKAVVWPYKCVMASTTVYKLNGYTIPTIVSYFQNSKDATSHDLGHRRLLMMTPLTELTPAMGYGDDFGFQVVDSYQHEFNIVKNQLTGSCYRRVFIERDKNYWYTIDATCPSLAEAINSAQLILSCLQS